MKSKSERQKLIKELIESNVIARQDVLLNILLAKGFELTQATLSRDMRELEIIKAPTKNGSYLYQVAENMDVKRKSQLASYGFVSLDFSGNLAVMKTRPGYAMGIASEIDQKITTHILGTVAGDDTILLILKEYANKETVVEQLSKFIPNLK